MKVLVVDDSLTTRGYIVDVLNRKGFSTLQAVNGVQALEKITEENPHVIVLDLLMPEMDGFEVLGKMRDSQNNTPVIVLTADIQDDVRQECVTLGAKAFLNKPFKANELIAAIENLK